MGNPTKDEIIGDDGDLSKREVARLCRIAISTVDALIANGALDAYRAGRVWRVRRESLDALRAGTK
ncbi:MAG TPA: helix-turn-helix domain-containing protein [Acidimicrobiales bacterium]|nr:helix-turn-helix domain-containing protein [Acidimicrobiales bacterium]